MRRNLQNRHPKKLNLFTGSSPLNQWLYSLLLFHYVSIWLYNIQGRTVVVQSFVLRSPQNMMYKGRDRIMDSAGHFTWMLTEGVSSLEIKKKTHLLFCFSGTWEISVRRTSKRILGPFLVDFRLFCVHKPFAFAEHCPPKAFFITLVSHLD